MKKAWGRTAGVILVEAALVAGLIWLLSINRTTWIIRMGIRAADQRILLSWILWAVAVVGVQVAMLVGARQRRRRLAQEPIRITFAPDKPLSPQEVRDELIRFQGERPQLRELLEQGLDQLDNIARKKGKMSEIIERNEVTLLNQASGALLEAEQTLCRKLALVLNRALLCDPQEENSRRREAVYAEHARAMQGFLAENEDVLNRCETLLTEAVRYVEARKAGRDGMDLQVMTDVIRSLTGGGIRINVEQGG